MRAASPTLQVCVRAQDLQKQETTLQESLGVFRKRDQSLNKGRRQGRSIEVFLRLPGPLTALGSPPT